MQVLGIRRVAAKARVVGGDKPRQPCVQASAMRRRPDSTRNNTSSRLNSCLLIDITATAHLPGPQNPGVCRLYLAEGCHLYIALTRKSRRIRVMVKSHIFECKVAGVQ